MREPTQNRLISKILGDAREEARSIIEDAKKSAERLLEQRNREAEERARKACQEIIKSAEDEVENIIHRESVDAIIKTRLILLSEKRKIIDDVFKRAEQRLREFTEDEAYPEMLERLIEEAAIAAGGGRLEILLNKADSRRKLPIKEIAKRVSSKLGVETTLETSDKPIDSYGGVIISSADGRTKADNTLASILERTRRRLEPEIARILFSDGLE
ncbi:MAG: V-type ATP synthase subunit E family protein [Candidatus Bathyarchaeia archaeon]